eukprot:SAG11_NODE_485_length_9035_cov_16.221352_2_plen_33_part_00
MGETGAQLADDLVLLDSLKELMPQLQVRPLLS